MTRAAIFVDAGYLFAQGSVALSGAKQPRTKLQLNVTAVIAELEAVFQAKTSGCELLRVYWYDGALGTRPTLEQTTLAHTDNVKLRLGFINSLGQQKGVDSLIVTDLIDLGRNHAICDAILLSGDEDVRIGVQIAQQFGVRIHLVGITPVRGSQSRTLQQEADTTTEWDQATVAKFLSIAAPVAPIQANVPVQPAVPIGANPDPVLEQVVVTLCASLDSTTGLSLKAHWQAQFGIPPEYDGKLLAQARAAVGRELTLPERKAIRARFKAVVQSTP
ncbi:MAG: NYN domain-containing protein [Alphaproteobacteria bacterium]|nr:NYN domain-containing protein [Alphaproteobacteria bacterium]MBV9063425.1 NYN domain-containing protein [Alphaproteobacteria bacterium]